MDRTAVRIVIVGVVLIVIVIISYAVVKGKNPLPDTAASVDPGSIPSTSTGTSNADLVRITDTAHLYSLEIPKDWKITYEGKIEMEGEALTRPSFVGGESPDWKIVSPDTIDAKGHIEGGAAVEFYVFNQNSEGAPSRIQMPKKFVSKRDMLIDDVSGALKTYKEYDHPNHEEALVLEAYANHKDNFFTFRIAFNPTTYPQAEEVFMRMLKSVQFTQ